jgi:hypothetical protein
MATFRQLVIGLKGSRLWTCLLSLQFVRLFSEDGLFKLNLDAHRPI